MTLHHLDRAAGDADDAVCGPTFVQAQPTCRPSSAIAEPMRHLPPMNPNHIAPALPAARRLTGRTSSVTYVANQAIAAENETRHRNPHGVPHYPTAGAIFPARAGTRRQRECPPYDADCRRASPVEAEPVAG